MTEHDIIDLAARAAYDLALLRPEYRNNDEAIPHLETIIERLRDARPSFDPDARRTALAAAWNAWRTFTSYPETVINGVPHFSSDDPLTVEGTAHIIANYQCEDADAPADLEGLGACVHDFDHREKILGHRERELEELLEEFKKYKKPLPSVGLHPDFVARVENMTPEEMVAELSHHGKPKESVH
jgi:hypothetical protein